MINSLAVVALLAGSVGDFAPIKATDCDGKVQTLWGEAGRKATVLIFLMPDCPISNAYAPEIKQLCKDYEPKKVAFFVVHADPDVTAQRAKEHAKEYGLPCPLLRDPTHELVKHTGVKIAPEVAVLAPSGKVIYRGRIDDWYVALGKRRGEPTQRDLRNALDAVLRGAPVATPATKAIGCPLPEPSK
jgi:peroxiredoxin